MLSGGERLRATLACVLCAEPAPQLLLLDEPTNNLDLVSVGQLESALDAYEGAFVVVSHDERFLARDQGGPLAAAGRRPAAGDRGAGLTDRDRDAPVSARCGRGAGQMSVIA